MKNIKREMAQLTIVSFFFLAGVWVGAVTFQPNAELEILGIFIAIATVFLFIGVANLVIEGLK